MPSRPSKPAPRSPSTPARRRSTSWIACWSTCSGSRRPGWTRVTSTATWTNAVRSTTPPSLLATPARPPSAASSPRSRPTARCASPVADRPGPGCAASPVAVRRAAWSPPCMRRRGAARSMRSASTGTTPSPVTPCASRAAGGPTAGTTGPSGAPCGTWSHIPRPCALGAPPRRPCDPGFPSGSSRTGWRRRCATGARSPARTAWSAPATCASTWGRWPMSWRRGSPCAPTSTGRWPTTTNGAPTSPVSASTEWIAATRPRPLDGHRRPGGRRRRGVRPGAGGPARGGPLGHRTARLSRDGQPAPSLPAAGSSAGPSNSSLLRRRRRT